MSKYGTPVDTGSEYGVLVNPTDLRTLIPPDADVDPDKTANALFYTQALGVPPEQAYELEPQINESLYGTPVSAAASKKIDATYDEAKTWRDSLVDGYRRAGVMMTKQLAGLGLAVSELSKRYDIDPPFFLKFLEPIDRWEEENMERLNEWSKMMLTGVEGYYKENPEEAIQIQPGLGYRKTLWAYITDPKKVVQGIIESSPLMMEGILGTVAGGATVAIGAMAVPISGEVYADARKEGTDIVPALGQAMVTGLGEAVIEQWTLGKKLGLFRNARQIVSKGVPKLLWEGTKVFLRGTAEEGSQEFNRNFWQWVFTDRSQAWTENMGSAAGAGGIMELGMAGGFAGTGYVVQKTGAIISKDEQLRRLDKIEAAVKDMADEQARDEILEELKSVRADVEAGLYPETVAKAAEVPVKAPTKPAEAITPAEPTITAPKAVEGKVERATRIFEERKAKAEKKGIAWNEEFERDLSKKLARGEEKLLSLEKGDTFTDANGGIWQRQGNDLVGIGGGVEGTSYRIYEQKGKNAPRVFKPDHSAVVTASESLAQPPAPKAVEPKKAKKPTGKEAQEFETPAEAKQAEAELEAEAAEPVRPKLWIGNVTEGMKKRVSESLGLEKEDIQGFKDKAFLTNRTEVEMTRAEAEEYLDWLERDMVRRLDKNLVRTENQLAMLNADWGDVANLRKVLGIEKGQAPFKVIRTKDHEMRVIKNTRSRIYQAIRLTDESKMTVGEVLSAVLKRSARFAKMAFAGGRKELRADLRAKARAKKRITKAVKTIGQKIPKSVDFFYREAIEALRSNIDLKSRSKRALANRKSTLDFIKRVPKDQRDIPTAVMKKISSKPLNELTIEELENVAAEVAKLIQQGKLKRKLAMKPILEQRKQDISDLTENTEKLPPLKKKPGPQVTEQDSRGKIETAANAAKLSTLTPSRILDMLDGKKNFSGLWHRIFFDAVKDVKAVFQRSVTKTKDAFRAEMTRIDMSMWHLAGSRVIGETRWTVEQIMGIYMAEKNPLSKAHLIYGHEMTNADIKQVIDSMSEQEKALADWMLDWYEVNYPSLRRAVIEQENRDMGKEEFYSPIIPLDKNWKTMQEEILAAAEQRMNLRRHNVAHGFTIERKDVPEHMRSKIRLDAVNMFFGQVQKQGRYINLGPQVRRMNKILANQNLRKIIKERFGSEMLATLDGYVASVANPYLYQQYGFWSRLSTYLRKNTAIAYLAYNLTTMMKQPFAVLFYLPDAGPRHLTASILEFSQHPLEMMQRVRDLDPEVRDVSMEREFEEIKNGKNSSFIKGKITEFGLEGIYFFDAVARTIGWNAVYQKALFENKSQAEAVRLARNATLRTQNAASAEDIPSLYRSNEVLNWFTLFTNQVNKMWNIAAYDVPSYFQNRNYAAAALGTVGLALNGIAMWMIANRKFPEEPEEFAAALVEQSIELMPLIGKPIMDGIEGWETDVPLFAAPKAIGKTAKAVWEQDFSKSDVWALSEGFSISVGLPHTAIKRTIKAVEEERPSALLGGRTPKKKKRKGFGG